MTSASSNTVSGPSYLPSTLPCMLNISIPAVTDTEPYLVNGFGGPLYHFPIAFPMLPTEVDETTAVLLEYTFANYSTLDNDFFIPAACQLVLWATGLGISVMLLLHVVTLTVPAKQWTALYWCVLLGCLAEVGVTGTAVWLLAMGGQNSVYLTITLDFKNNEWSTGWKVAAGFHLMLGLCALAAVECGLCIQGQGLLQWVRLKWNAGVYRTILFSLVFLAVAAVLTEAIIDVWLLLHLNDLTDVTARKSMYAYHRTGFSLLTKLNAFALQASIFLWPWAFIASTALGALGSWKTSIGYRSKFACVSSGLWNMNLNGMTMIFVCVFTSILTLTQAPALVPLVILVKQPTNSLFVQLNQTESTQSVAAHPTNRVGQNAAHRVDTTRTAHDGEADATPRLLPPRFADNERGAELDSDAIGGNLLARQE